MIESGEAKLLELLNQTFTPQKALTEKNVKFNTLVDDAGEGYNTGITIVGNPGKGYYGSVSLKYRRVDLSIIGSNVELRKEGKFTVQDICDALNSSQNTFIGPNDLTEGVIPDLAPGDSVQYTLVANPASMGWTGSQEITLRYGKPYLSVILGRKVLPELLPPAGRYDYPAAWALCYYQDFTSFRDSLKIDPETKVYKDASAIQAITFKLGIPNWAVSSPVDLPTSAVPTSNQAFDRVVVQSYVGSGVMYGPLYLHYNTTKFDGA